MAIASGHRWPMRSNLQQSNGLDALFKSTRQHISENAILTFPTFFFDYRSGQMGTANHKNMNSRNEYLERTRRPGSLICLQIQLKRILGLNARCLFGPGRTWTSSPKLVPTPLILFGTSQPCSSCYSGTDWATRAETQYSFELNFETKQLARSPRLF
jgi:hypothetical protein